MGKSSINGPFSMAMLNNQRVHQFWVGNGSNPSLWVWVKRKVQIDPHHWALLAFQRATNHFLGPYFDPLKKQISSTLVKQCYLCVCVSPLISLRCPWWFSFKSHTTFHGKTSQLEVILFPSIDLDLWSMPFRKTEFPSIRVAPNTLATRQVFLGKYSGK